MKEWRVVYHDEDNGTRTVLWIFADDIDEAITKAEYEKGYGDLESVDLVED